MRGRDAFPGKRSRRRRRRQLSLATVALVLVIVAISTARIFVWPATGMPNRVDAIVVPAGPYAPVGAALALAHAHRARYVLISLGHDGYGGSCPPAVRQVTLICFDPSPATTQGEAEYASRLARQHRWRSLAVVAIAPQEWRARHRIQRCFSGSVYGVARSVPWYSWPYQIVYEWGATIKMLVFQRNC